MKKRILKLSCFGLIFMLLLSGAAGFLKVNSLPDSVRIKGFYLEPKDSLNMVTIGASETYTAIAPGLLWKEFGFTSYNYSVAGSPISIVKSQVKEILANQDPKVIVIEINGTLQDDEYQINEKRLRKYIDNIPWSVNKINTIKEIVPEDQQTEYFIPFLKYHSNWQSLDLCIANFYLQSRMMLEGSSRLKGFQTISGAEETKSKVIDVKGDTSVLPLSEKAEYYLRDLLQYLKDEGIDNVLFMRTPHRITKKSYPFYQRANEAEKIIKEYGFPYVNFETQKDEIGLSMMDDFYNNHHLNLYGQKKFTNYFGNYMVEHYDLKDSVHLEKVIKEWDKTAEDTEDCLEYVETMIEDKNRSIINEGWKEARRLHLTTEE